MIEIKKLDDSWTWYCKSCDEFRFASKYVQARSEVKNHYKEKHDIQ